jgi:hypothetical protein
MIGLEPSLDGLYRIVNGGLNERHVNSARPTWTPQGDSSHGSGIPICDGIGSGG